MIRLMLNCVNDVHKILEDEALEIDFELKPGTLFTNGADIYTAKEIKDGCWYFDLFRFDEEFVSNNWTASTSQEVSTSNWSPIAVKTLDKVQKRF